jgi:3-oxoisoapionate decarboxylase
LTDVEIGISTWSVPWAIGITGYPQLKAPLGAIGLMRRAVELDVRVVQLADNFPLDQLREPELEEIAKRAAEWELTLELGTRSLDVPHLRRYVETASRMGSGIVRTVLSGSFCGRDELERTRNALRELLPDLERREVALALENNEAFAAAEFSEIIAAVSSPLVGICLDTANSLGRPETFQTVTEELAAHTIMLHAKDYEIRRIDTRMGFTIEGRALGDGRVDFEFVLGQLREYGRDGLTAVIEHWPPYDGDIESSVEREAEWLTRSLAHLRPLV